MHEGLAALARLPALAPAADHVHPGGQRLRLRAAVARPERRSTRRWRQALLAPTGLADDILAQPERGRDGEAAVPRDRPRGRAGLPGLPAAGASGAAAPGVERPVLRRVPRVRPRQPAALAGAARGAGAAAREQPPAAAPSPGSPRRAVAITDSPRPTPLAFPLLVDRMREQAQLREARRPRPAHAGAGCEKAADG